MLGVDLRRLNDDLEERPPGPEVGRSTAELLWVTATSSEGVTGMESSYGGIGEAGWTTVLGST